MKRILLAFAIMALAFAVQAGEGKTCPRAQVACEAKTACGAKDKADCAAKVKSGCCPKAAAAVKGKCPKAEAGKKSVMSPKAATEAGQ